MQIFLVLTSNINDDADKEENQNRKKNIRIAAKDNASQDTGFRWIGAHREKLY